MLNNKTTKNTWKQVIYAEWRFFLKKKKQPSIMVLMFQSIKHQKLIFWNGYIKITSH